MKLADLNRHLRQQGCVLYRKGRAHTIWLNSDRGKIASMPRHREIKEGTVRVIYKQLEIPQPETRSVFISALSVRFCS